MAILAAALSIVLAMQWIVIARINKKIDVVRTELDKQSGTIRGLKLIFQMISKKSKERVDL